jgi:hypothetical protein
VKVPTPAAANAPSTGGAAGLGDIFSGVKAVAIRFLNYFTDYEMNRMTYSRAMRHPRRDRRSNSGVVGSLEAASVLPHGFT